MSSIVDELSKIDKMVEQTMDTSKGYIYILTNPSFPDYVKIGYADNVEARLKQLNSTECTPFAFRVYWCQNQNA